MTGSILLKKSHFLYTIKDLIFSYSMGAQSTQVLHSVNLEMPSNELITLSGPSGSGKSTLLNLLALIEPIQKGTISFFGEPLSEISERRKNEIRRFHIGFIFQQFHLVPVLTASENIGAFLTYHGLSRKQLQERVEESLVAVDLWEYRHKKPSELSGGQKQRVAIARALAKKPALIIGDEPTASLDRASGQNIMELLRKEVAEANLSVIIATHDPMVQSFAFKNYHFHEGQLHE